MLVHLRLVGTVDEAVKLWLSHLEEVVYEADNLMDEIRYHRLRHKVHHGKKMLHKVCDFFSKLEMSKKIKEIRKNLDEIKADKITVDVLTKREMSAHST